MRTTQNKRRLLKLIKRRYAGGGLFKSDINTSDVAGYEGDQALVADQQGIVDEAVLDPLADIAPPPQASGAELTGQGGYDEAIMSSKSDQAANKIVDAIPIAKLFRGLGEAGSNAIIGDSTGEQRKKKQKWAAAIFAPHKFIAMRKADKNPQEEKREETQDEYFNGSAFYNGGKFRVIKKKK